MAKLVFVLFVLAVIVKTGFSLKCYNCDSDKVSECLKKGSPKEITCGNAVAPQKPVCYYFEAEDTTKKTTKIKSSCALMTSGVAPETLAECKEMDGMKRKECRVCETDLCNSAPALSTSFFLLLCLPFIYLSNKLF